MGIELEIIGCGPGQIFLCAIKTLKSQFLVDKILNKMDNYEELEKVLVEKFDTEEEFKLYVTAIVFQLGKKNWKRLFTELSEKIDDDIFKKFRKAQEEADTIETTQNV